MMLNLALSPYYAGSSRVVDDRVDFMLAAVDTLAIKKISDALAHCTLTIVTPGQLVLGSKVPTRNGARWTRPAARLAPADARLDAGRRHDGREDGLVDRGFW